MNTLVLQREFLTVREAAARWRVSEKTIRRWIAAGELVALQPAPGHALRIPADALETQFFCHEAEAPAERRAPAAGQSTVRQLAGKGTA